MRTCIALLFALLSPWAAGVEKLHFEAYSVQAPTTTGWLVTRGGAYDVAFGAALTTTHTWVMSAAAVPLHGPFEDDEAFLSHVRETFIRDSDATRFHIVATKSELTRLNGATCTRLRVKAEDRLAGGGEAVFFMIEATQLTCIHPSAPGLAIELGYHERYLPGEASGAFSQVGEHFIRSVRFWKPVPGHRLAASPALPGQGR